MTFEYSCKKCGIIIEVNHPIGKAPKTTKCVGCGGRAPRMYTAPGIKFRGTGFHVNDYGAGSTPKGD